MKAKELLDKYVHPNHRDELGIIAVSDNLGYWYHVHEDEDLPLDDDKDTFTIAIAKMSSGLKKVNKELD
ncbi:MAG: hypothetical protein ACOCZ5_02215 [bacterium]